MPTLLHHLLFKSVPRAANRAAIVHKKTITSYGQLAENVQQQAEALLGVHLKPQQRVAIFLPKQLETVSSVLAISLAGGVFVPINPVLKAPQVAHILTDCTVHILITSYSRLQNLAMVLADCPDLHTIVLVDYDTTASPLKDWQSCSILGWQTYLQQATTQPLPRLIDTDMAAILYTSGSTGKPKGVVLSHRNLVTGAKSVSEYLHITEEDCLLAVLPFSFDYGLNQLLSALLNGACCVLLDYLLPRDVLNTLATQKITGLACVPPLWSQLAKLDWPEGINEHLRYLTNSGGKLPKLVLAAIRQRVPNGQFFLMYGLTEAFRSTYLPPEQLDDRPDSIGKAIPNADILVVREDGTPCAPHEQGELVHRGSLVAMGYWNDAIKTAERFKPAPHHNSALPFTEIAVWSGDTVTMDEDGYLYFVGRKDDMIKSAGYRISPTEIEEVIYSSGVVKEAAAIGIEHDSLGQAVVVVISLQHPDDYEEAVLMKYCQAQLPNFMQPAKIIVLANLPKNPNGKIDRNTLVQQFADIFQS
ncbi:MAG: acyl-CoA ligase (AMP-forming), exosortase A system-associated [Methylococcales bacterium]|nr:acyl-CoA ligase (AMP-forming), exosortase A system-associated [Methylococcales bacterium]